MIILSQKIVIIKKHLWLIVGVRGNCVKFICFFQKVWYINYDEGVICANWVANPYLKR